MLIKRNLSISILILSIILILFIITPSKISKSYNGISYDFNDDNMIEPVTVNINGILKRDFMLRPKTFEGNILIGSNQFEITEPTSFRPIPYGKENRYFELCLDYENVTNWKLNHDTLYDRFGQRALWIIYTDRNFSYISIVPMPPNKDGGWASSSQIITVPCNNRDDAINITKRLRTGGYSLKEQ